MSVNIQKRTSIECACGQTHPIIEWSTWGAYAYVPVIECPLAPRSGEVILMDTRLAMKDGEPAFPKYRGLLWVKSRG